MSNNITVDTLKAIVSLTPDPDFQVIVQWLTDELTRRRMLSDEIKDELTLRWNQGYCQALRDILINVNSAISNISKINKNREDRNTGSQNGKT